MKKTEWGFTFRATEDIVTAVNEYARESGFSQADALRHMIITFMKEHQFISEGKASKMWIERRNWRKY